MLILQTAHTYAPEANGVSEIARQISMRLVRRGHEVHVATALKDNFPCEQKLDGVTVHRFRARGNWLLGMSGDIADYVRFVRSRSWDVIIMQCGQNWTTDSLLPLLSSLSGVKIFAAQGLSAFDSPRYAAYFAFLAEALKDADGLVGLSARTEEARFARTFGFPAPTIIPNGVAAEQFRYNPLGMRKQWGIARRPWLLSVGNHNPHKGHKDFFELLRQVRRQRPEVMGTIIGGNYGAAKWNLGRLGVKGGCWYLCRVRSVFGRGVQLQSGIQRAEVVSAFQEADLVIVASNWEASPLVVLESMAAGTPWVAFDVGCVREHPGGIVVDSICEMAETVVGLLNDPERRKELGQEGKAEIARKHDWELVTDHYERLFSELLQRRETIMNGPRELRGVQSLRWN